MEKYDELLARLDNLIRTHEGKLIDCHDAAAAIRELEAKLDAERKAREEADEHAIDLRNEIIRLDAALAATPSPLLPGLERDAERYRARRYTIYKDRLRIEMPQGKNWRPTTFEDFCAEYDAACDKEIEKQATEISRLKGEGSDHE